MRPDGVLDSVLMSGHTGYAASGRDIVCAAAGGLIRSFAAAADLWARVSVNAPHPGELYLVVGRVERGRLDRFLGAQTVLTSGMRMLAYEYPKHVEFTIHA